MGPNARSLALKGAKQAQRQRDKDAEASSRVGVTLSGIVVAGRIGFRVSQCTLIAHNSSTAAYRARSIDRTAQTIQQIVEDIRKELL